MSARTIGVPTAMDGSATEIKLPFELHPFVTLVLGDPALQERLGAERDADGFVTAAAALAAAHNVPLDPVLLRAQVRPDPLGLGRFDAAPIMLDHWPPHGWLPTRSVAAQGALAFDWLWLGGRRLTRPLYEEDVRAGETLPLNALLRVRTGLAALTQDAKQHNALPLAGLIFHMSRCGSTLAGRMLMASSRHAVASEPEPIDAVLQWAIRSGVSHGEQVEALRAIVAALGRDRANGQQKFFVKLDAWHALALPLLRDAFPAVPWIFLYRDPVEVIMSHQGEPGLHFVPGAPPPALADLNLNDGSTSEADYTARVLARICGAVVENWPLGGGLLVPFETIYRAMGTAVAEHFGFHADVSEIAAMATVTTVNAKRPSAAFSPDGAEKRKSATPAVIAAAATHVAAPIALLDNICRGAITPSLPR